VEHSEVFVIGAGPAGLTAAYLLTKAGVATTVIEADPIYRRH
jgi:flavin-dependent dehydrogenase